MLRCLIRFSLYAFFIINRFRINIILKGSQVFMSSYTTKELMMMRCRVLIPQRLTWVDSMETGACVIYGCCSCKKIICTNEIWNISSDSSARAWVLLKFRPCIAGCYSWMIEKMSLTIYSLWRGEMYCKWSVATTWQKLESAPQNCTGF